eukprot:s171_g18.t1
MPNLRRPERGKKVQSGRHPLARAAQRKDRSGEIPGQLRIVQKGIEHAEFHRLLQLRSRLRDCDDHLACRRTVLSRQPQTLLRFLRARNGDLQKAEVMFRKMLEWRHAFSVEEKVQQWKAELEEQSTQRSIQMRRYETDVELCRDRHGVPVRLVRTSVADVQGLVREFGKDLVLIDTIMRMERTHEEIRRAMLDTENVIAGQLQIIDMGDYGQYGVPNLTTWRYCIQPLLPERTQHKLVPCGPKASSWEAQLGAELDLTALPAFLCEETTSTREIWEFGWFWGMDSDAAFEVAVPRGGLVPAGLAGKDQGTWHVEPAMKKKPADRSFSRRSQKCPEPRALEFSLCSLASSHSPQELLLSNQSPSYDPDWDTELTHIHAVDCCTEDKKRR